MSRNFDKWLDTFQSCISDYSYYIDFDKVFRNINTMKHEINILNSLIASKSIEDDFEEIINKYPSTLHCIPILLAIRSDEIYAMDEEGGVGYNFSFKKQNYSINDYKIFMRKTGLFNLLENHLISSLMDYVTGVETGLDSNGRKNRGGQRMENIVENYIQKANFQKDLNYFKEMYINQIENKWGLNLSAISNKGKAEKRFDFVIKTSNQIYLIETNFYQSPGSKLNETARSYKTLAEEVKTIDGVTFIWITDGKGWISARNNLEETFDVLETIYNIYDLKNGILTKLV